MNKIKFLDALDLLFENFVQYLFLFLTQLGLSFAIGIIVGIIGVLVGWIPLLGGIITLGLSCIVLYVGLFIIPVGVKQIYEDGEFKVSKYFEMLLNTCKKVDSKIVLYILKLLGICILAVLGFSIIMTVIMTAGIISESFLIVLSSIFLMIIGILAIYALGLKLGTTLTLKVYDSMTNSYYYENNKKEYKWYFLWFLIPIVTPYVLGIQYMKNSNVGFNEKEADNIWATNTNNVFKTEHINKEIIENNTVVNTINNEENNLSEEE